MEQNTSLATCSIKLTFVRLVGEFVPGQVTVGDKALATVVTEEVVLAAVSTLVTQQVALHGELHGADLAYKRLDVVVDLTAQM